MYLGALNGFVRIGDINSHLAEYEKQVADKEVKQPLATSMLVLMVRGLFTHLKFPCTQFPCTELSGTMMICLSCHCTQFFYDTSTKCVNFNCLFFHIFSEDQWFVPVWEAVYCLENMGFKVLALCCDGLAANRRLFSLHKPGSTPPMHKVLNPHAHDGEKRYLWFLSDPPHLMKTVRNSWETANKSSG